MYTKIRSLIFTNEAIKEITIEANIYRGMFAFNVLGVSSTYERKIREKINAIFKLNGQKLPNKKMVFNVEIIDEKYDYELLDLPIFIALLKILKIHNFKDEYYTGSFGIKGDLLPLEYPYKLINFLKTKDDIKINIPYDDNLVLATKINNISMYKNVLDLLHNRKYVLSHVKEFEDADDNSELDINSIIGQERLIRALIISIVGKHHLIVSGVAGTGKSLSFKAIQSLLPDLTYDEQLLVNAYNNSSDKFIRTSNFTEVAKNITMSEFCGSKTKISLLNKNLGGFLIFDEINLYPNKILDTVKSFMDLNRDQNKEEKYITIFANMNPCPCGNYGSKYKKCTCSMGAINSFQNKIKKPFIDRFHIKVKTDSEFNDNEYNSQNKYNIADIKNKIMTAWNMQKNRYNNKNFSYNGFVKGKDLSNLIKFNKEIENKLDEFVEFYKLSMREKHNIIRVSRSIADYEASKFIKLEHLFEAVSYQIL